MLQDVAPVELLLGTNEVMGNVATTAGVVTGGASVVAATVPAGVDDVSALASAASAAHAANFLAVSAVDHAEFAHYGVSLASVAGGYLLTDTAGVTHF